MSISVSGGDFAGSYSSPAAVSALEVGGSHEIAVRCIYLSRFSLDLGALGLGLGFLAL